MFGGKRILRVLSVMAVALAAGQLAETLRPSASGIRVAASNPAPEHGKGRVLLAAGVLGAASLADGSGSSLPLVTAITSVAATIEGRGPADCDPVLRLSAAPAAMIDLVLSAPCNRGERLVIRHSGLSFTAQTSPDGQLHLQIPAFESEALVAAYFHNSEVALSRVDVPEALSHARIAVQMALPAQFDLRANEGGQVYVGSSGRSGEGSQRRIISLGSSSVPQPILAQVYTLPANDLSAADMTVELRITPETCGRTIPAEIILGQGGNVSRSIVPVTVPLCGTSGDILLLKNLLRDLTLTVPG